MVLEQGSWTGRAGFDSWQEEVIFFRRCAQTGSGVHPASYPIGTTGSFSRPWCEADHSPPCSAKFMNVWNCNSSSPYVFIASCLIKYSICLHGLVLIKAHGQLNLYLRLNRVWENAFRAHFKVVSWHQPGGTEEYHSDCNQVSLCPGRNLKEVHPEVLPLKPHVQ
jgi:hypothetical protein